ncbi:patatin-like phospholipase family protein [Nocardioides sp. WL0053]|uniref:Patatin-like phospholipase family protein n=1 Tax=Nocardioides jiangsuensis TaxID=2866161 RepID=A0ABS7RQF8_9ACTN|nr:patatin-like phospholipase family protein [Nocardioides jiangsuensis]MBY9075802.1 patatin-like phospholipase family protein [Nocardioides jiangsuensis]
MDVSGSYDAPSGPADETGRPAGRTLHDTDATGPAAEHLRADLVLEGGGVKGIALVGATLPLVEAGYRFPRVAGSSAGAIVGAVLAALQRRGEPIGRLEDVSRSLDYRRFRDRGFPGRYLGPLGFLTDGLSVLLEDGVYEGDYLHDWLDGVLRDLGVETFGDLRTDDPGDDGTMHHRYGLVVTASDLSRRRLLQLPWDYPEYGLDPDEQRVADAVRASASIPYFFEPVTLRGTAGTSTLVDGGLLSNYPIGVFDRLDERVPRWPTLGVRLDALRLGGPGNGGAVSPVRGPVALGVALVQTAIEANQAEHVLDPCNVARSVYVDTGGVSAVDFGLDEGEQDQLLAAGQEAARAFLETWDFERWLADCR